MNYVKDNNIVQKFLDWTVSNWVVVSYVTQISSVNRQL